MSAGSPAIDRTPDRDPTERFHADLTNVWRGSGTFGIAVSGGPDSVALLLLADAALPGQVEAVTVDHRLRHDSGHEAALVEQICVALKVPHRIIEVSLAAGNMQAAARQARYRAIEAWAKERNLAAVATAHHADDQAETLLMRLNRSSGLSGLASIRAKTTIQDTAIPLLRPLLQWRKTELMAVVEASPFTAADDPSNADMRFDRAVMRARLAEVDWLDPAALARSAQLICEASDYIQAGIHADYAQTVVRSGNSLRYHAGSSDFQNIEIVALIIENFGGTPARSEVKRMVERLGAGETSSLSGILARSSKRSDQTVWTFAPEPPRKAGEH